MINDLLYATLWSSVSLSVSSKGNSYTEFPGVVFNIGMVFEKEYYFVNFTFE